MTLKEKFSLINCIDCHMPYCEIKCTILKPSELNYLEKIADEFSIGFAEWYFKKAEKYNSHLKLVADTKKILEIYKKEKGL